MAVFSGNAHPKLAHDIARRLHVPLAKAHVGRFSDGEINVEILENIRGRETFIIQPTCPPSSENLMELLVTNVDGKLVRPDYEEDEVTQAALVVYQGEVRF